MSNLNSVIKWENLSERDLIRAQLDIAEELLRRKPYRDDNVYEGVRFGNQDRSSLEEIDVTTVTKKPLKRNDVVRVRQSDQEVVDSTIYSTRPMRESRQLRPEEVVINDTIYTPVMSTQPRSRQVRTTTYELPPNTSIMPQEVVSVTTPVSSGSRSPVYRVKRND